jgi:hypothetical protein
MLDKICSIFCGGHAADERVHSLRSILSDHGIGIVSASCCAPMAAQNDKALEKNLHQALVESDRAPDYQVISITDAQKALGKLKQELTPAQQRLVMQIQGMVSTQGFSVFPILMLGGRIAYYGGLPTPEMIAEKLPSAPLDAGAARADMAQTAAMS